MKKLIIGLFLLIISCKCNEPPISPTNPYFYNSYPVKPYSVNPYPINPYLINPYLINHYPPKPLTCYHPQLNPIILSKPSIISVDTIHIRRPNIHIDQNTYGKDSIPIVITEKFPKPKPYKITIKRDSTDKPFPVSIYIDPQTGTVVTEKGNSTKNEVLEKTTRKIGSSLAK